MDLDIEFLVIPKQESKSKCVELLITDPIEGIHLVKENAKAGYYKYASQLEDAEDEEEDTDPFGKVKYIALSAKKNFLAMYCDPDTTGKIIVLKADLKQEMDRKDTYQMGAQQLAWCGNDCMVLSVFDKLVIIGPKEHEFIELKARSEGIYCMTEMDGLRVLNSEKTYFFERVQDSLKNTFSLASIYPSAKLHNAQKSVDFNNPRADEIIRDLGKKTIDGIESLMNAAEYEHKDIDVLKHLLTTASFAKKFSDP